jgi:hypothetical protein
MDPAGTAASARDGSSLADAAAGLEHPVEGVTVQNGTRARRLAPAAVRVREAPRGIPCRHASMKSETRARSTHHSAAMNSQTAGSTHICRGAGPGGIEGIILDSVCTHRRNGLQYALATF